jgi:hypothetical protein
MFRITQLLMGALILTFLFMLRPPVLGGTASYITVQQADLEPLLYEGDLAIVRTANEYAAGELVAVETQSGPFFGRILGQEGEIFQVRLAAGAESVAISHLVQCRRLWTEPKRDGSGAVQPGRRSGKLNYSQVNPGAQIETGRDGRFRAYASLIMCKGVCLRSDTVATLFPCPSSLFPRKKALHLLANNGNILLWNFSGWSGLFKMSQFLRQGCSSLDKSIQITSADSSLAGHKPAVFTSSVEGSTPWRRPIKRSRLIPLSSQTG